MRSLLFLVIGLGLGGAGAWYWLAPADDAAAASAKAELYTCPMHPQILQDEPGTCPICGMDLVSKSTDSAKSKSQSVASQSAGSQPADAHAAHGGDAVAASFTCPMHPQIVEPEAGECPICGMDLVEKAPAASQPAASQPAASQPAASQPAAAQPAHDHAASAGGAPTISYTCSMHPQINQDEPGTCPICGMDLVQRVVGARAKDGEGPEVTIDPVTRQNMGVRLARAKAGRITRAVRTVGTVMTPEDRQAVVNLRYSGWITKLHIAETGVAVSKGDPLFEIYSPELVGAQQEYAVARRTAGPKSSLAKAAKQRLKLYQASALTRWIDRGKAPLTRFTVRAPAAGHVLHLNVIDGGRVNAGADLYRIADLSRVWVEAEVYAHDAPHIQVGAPAQIELAAGETRDARVDYLYPTLDPKTRTLRVRMELPNSQANAATLRPGDIATVHIAAEGVTADVVVPAAAIVHSGTRSLVFVHRGDGRFAPQEVEVGLRGDDGQLQIRAGLEAGAEIVTSGQFLIDSESQLQEAIQKMMDR
ncbi:MAG: Cu(I)/Ag(I) efflux system membrane fusion protein [Bradymonadia bacterium]|jgi:Cu(I)/Ag(I) efflux system membrane fusion protein